MELIKPFLILSILTTLVSCGEKTTVTNDAPIVAVHSTVKGTPLLGKWKNDQLPLKFKISDSFSDDEVDLIFAIEDKWDEAVDHELHLLEFDPERIENKEITDTEKYNEDDVIGIYKMESKWTDDASEEALAITRYSSVIEAGGIPRFKHVDIILNEHIHDFGDMDDEELTKEDKRKKFDLGSVLIHEIGHALGLDHLSGSTRKVVMAAALGRGMVRRAPASEDQFAMKDLYQIGDTETTIINLVSEEEESEQVIIPLEKNAFNKVGTIINGVVELRADGKCRHFKDGVLVKEHKHNM